MANHHYGRIGDVWKHLLLAEIVRAERPLAYWESHAGSATYPLTHSWERDYGVYLFEDKAGSYTPLVQSNYVQLLAANAESYLGSAAMAMCTLGNEAQFLLCDTDPHSIASLREFALQLGIAVLHLHAGEGNAMILQQLQSQEHLDRVLVFLDPWDCLAPSANRGPSSADLVRECLERGAIGILWFGFDDLARRDTIVSKLPKPGWLGEIVLDVISAPERPNPGCLGCGMFCVNLTSQTLATLQRLGDAFEQIYRGSSLAPGYSGALTFHFQYCVSLKS